MTTAAKRDDEKTSTPARRAEGSDLPWRLVVASLLVCLILAVAELLVPTIVVLLVVFGGVLCGIFLNGITRWFENWLPISYRWTYTLIVGLLLAFGVAGFSYMGAQIAAQVAELSEQLQSAGQQLTARLEEYAWAKPYLAEDSNIGDMLSGGVLPTVMYSLQTSVWALTALAIVLCVGLYLAYDPDLYTEGVTRLIPPARRDSFRQLLRKIYTVLGYWIVGRLLSMTLVGVLTTIGLWILGVPLPITLGVLAALFTFIPNIGPILAAVPQALLALQVDVNTVMYVLVLNVALQTIESYLITPLIQQYEVMLPPALTIAAQVLMGALVGIMGVVMAAPLTATGMVVVQMLYIGRYLQDPEPGELVESC